MKQKFLLASSILFFSCTALKAQIEKGKLLLGGTIGYNAVSGSSYGSSSTSNAAISPRIGYAVGKNSVIGILGNVGHSTQKADPNYKTTNTSYGVFVYWRKFMPIQNKLGWYTDLQAGFSGSKQEQKGPNYSYSRATGYGATVIPGLYYQIVPKLLISANTGGVYFNRFKSKQNDGSSSRGNNWGLSFLNNFQFGVDFILGKKSA